MISKLAGGLGLYIGKLRSRNSDIQNFKGVGSGVIPVIKLFNDMMVYVNQLGIRKGSISITLDIWHKDILDFLEIKTNAGDERMKAHDIHPAVSIPDIFMKRLLNNEKWTLIDPYFARQYLTKKFYSSIYVDRIINVIRNYFKNEFDKDNIYIKIKEVDIRKVYTTSYMNEPYNYRIKYKFGIKIPYGIKLTEKNIYKLYDFEYISSNEVMNDERYGSSFINYELMNFISKVIYDTDKELIKSRVSTVKYIYVNIENDIESKIIKDIEIEIDIYTYGIGIEDFYGEKFEELYKEIENVLPDRYKSEINSFELWKKLLTVIFETGEPYIFFRDNANRLNPNKHIGIVYSSNLCMEIIQSMKPLRVRKENIYIHENDKNTIAKVIDGGLIPTCNLGAINLGNINIDDDNEIYNVLRTLVEALDNIISLSEYASSIPIKTNVYLRPIGIGVMNYHYCLVKHNIRWESEEHLEFTDKLFEKIAYYTIKSSMELAKEKERYYYFKGSDWEKGIWFGRSIDEIHKESKCKLDWKGLYEEVKRYGLRNGYLLALMPTGSTSLIIGATPSIDPIFDKFYKEENMSGILPQLPPEIDKYYWHYKSAYNIDQNWIIKAGAIRQKWIDQSQSLNIFINPLDIDGYKLSEIYINAWKEGLKTVYYCRSKSITDIEECESCSV